MTFRPLVVGIGGTQRQGSSSELALRRTLSHACALGAVTEIFVASELDLPLYSPDTRERTHRAIRLVDAMRRADGIIVATPGYHGSISGLIKNALDYAEDMRNDPYGYLDGRALGCIAIGHGWQATVTALATLRSIAHALRAWPTPLGGCINSSSTAFGIEGSPSEPSVDVQLKTIAGQVVEFATMRKAYERTRQCISMA